MANSPNLAQLIAKHRVLDDAIKNSKGHFLSDWNGEHPFVENFLGSDLANLKLVKPSPSRYIYFEEEHDLIDSICALHSKFEALELTRLNIVAGSGSSSLLVALSLWLLQQEYDEIYYSPPLYYTFHYFLKTLNIRLRPVSGTQLFETDSVLNLPDKQTVFLLCDPIWYVGRSVPLEKIRLIADWQRETKSLVFVDGSFQYMQWNGNRHENTSILDPELTFRLISPTKSLAIPFFRFAYLLLPSKFHNDFVFLYESIIGGASIADLAFAHRALEVLSNDKSNCDLTTYLQDTYTHLVEKN